MTYTVNLTATDYSGTGAIIIVVIEVVDPHPTATTWTTMALSKWTRPWRRWGTTSRTLLAWKRPFEVVNLYFGI